MTRDIIMDHAPSVLLPRQQLHWVFKVGNLHTSLAFFCQRLGMRVLRHEEFTSGCDAQCNGPYARPWSKTMVGYGPEHCCFVFELTFNYGIRQYARGNGIESGMCDAACVLRHACHILSIISLNNDAYRPRVMGYMLWSTCYGLCAPPRRSDLERIELMVDDETWKRVIEESDAVDASRDIVDLASPDGYKFRIRRTGTTPAVAGVAINVSNARMHDTVEFYQRAIGYDIKAKSQSSVTLQLPGDHTTLTLLSISDPIDHSVAIGRLAVSVPATDLDAIQETVDKRTAGSVHTPKIGLDTPGKARVEVVISLDPEGYEVCTVGGKAFFELCAPKPGCDQINWEERRENGSKE